MTTEVALARVDIDNLLRFHFTMKGLKSIVDGIWQSIIAVIVLDKKVGTAMLVVVVAIAYVATVVENTFACVAIADTIAFAFAIVKGIVASTVEVVIGNCLHLMASIAG